MIKKDRDMGRNKVFEGWNASYERWSSQPGNSEAAQKIIGTTERSLTSFFRQKETMKNVKQSSNMISFRFQKAHWNYGGHWIGKK